MRPLIRSQPRTPPILTTALCVDGRTLQGYNTQAAATIEQTVVAAELTQQANDVQQLTPMLSAIRNHPGRRRHRCSPTAAGGRFWFQVDRQGAGDPDAPQLLILRPVTAATASPARTASPRRPRATACAPYSRQARKHSGQDLLRAA
jgi:hypothetical protein